ncbi:hypothetical protein [Streptomyces sp. NPDC059262]
MMGLTHVQTAAGGRSRVGARSAKKSATARKGDARKPKRSASSLGLDGP